MASPGPQQSIQSKSKEGWIKLVQDTGIPKDWQFILSSNKGYAPQDSQISPTATLYGTIPHDTLQQFKDIVHLTLQRDSTQINPIIIILLKPWL